MLNLFGETVLLTADDAVAAGVVGGIAAGAFMAVGLFALIFYVLVVIAWWKIFVKAGEKGWKAIIPIYNMYIMYKIVKMELWFWISLCVGIVAGIVFTASGLYTSTGEIDPTFNFGANPGVIITILISAIVSIYTGILYAWRMAKAFGHGVGYTIGLIFLPYIFLLILGFGHDKFNKKKLDA